ncbi:MAG: VOC family protein [Acidimicrobiales bacterium]
MGVGSGSVLHVNVNCTDLEQSVAFYERLGFSRLTRTAPDQPQPGGAFGLDLAQWDAWIMGGATGFAAPVIDLLEWKVPPPSHPPAGARLGFRSVHLRGELDASVDPDGLALDVQRGDAGLTGITVACSDLGRSRAFYDELGVGSFVNLVQDVGAAPPPSAANSIGAWRMALATEHLDDDVAELAVRGVRCLSEPVEMSMGPGLPLLRFVLFPDPDGTMLELIQRPTA